MLALGSFLSHLCKCVITSDFLMKTIVANWKLISVLSSFFILYYLNNKNSPLHVETKRFECKRQTIVQYWIFCDVNQGGKNHQMCMRLMIFTSGPSKVVAQQRHKGDTIWKRTHPPLPLSLKWEGGCSFHQNKSTSKYLIKWYSDETEDILSPDVLWMRHITHFPKYENINSHMDSNKEYSKTFKKSFKKLCYKITNNIYNAWNMNW